ncbi:transketolase [Clostridium tyrobutyricum]|uniref:transketolase n=1 Tax=Clostridium tyrobutyricum TaxID=1519 RepID=UPI001C37F7FA|nr:transketolase [Clostridium tyrobutyricum]MBV4418867.1 transketolase [Clostridium tyrobutyricum]
MLDKNKIKELNIFATKMRIETIRQIATRGFGHIGGAMSICDVLAVLYGDVMKIDPKNPKWDKRDWFICSKGHAGPAVYSALALKGFFPVEELKTLNQNGTNLPSHCDRTKTRGIDVTTGSLGQGLSVGTGVALGHRLDKKDNYTYVILGDGECEEGQVWEAVLYASQRKTSNLIAFVDYNRQQIDGYTKDINDLGDICQKFKDFGWYALSIDGSKVEEIENAIEKAKSQNEKPSVIVLNTKKGEGCSFAENTLNNHHINVSMEQGNEAIKILEKKLNTLMNN